MCLLNGVQSKLRSNLLRFAAIISLAGPVLCFSVAGARPASAAGENDKCLMCHSAPALSKQGPDGKIISLHVDEQVFRQSVHGKRLCTDCHTAMRGQTFPHKSSVSKVMCSSCHFMGNPVGAPVLGSVTEYADSVHGRAVKRGDPDAPRCASCHGSHNIRRPTDPQSSVYRSNIPTTCGKCHGDPAFLTRHKIPARVSYQIYRESVHGRAVDHHPPFAVCTDCHGAHTIQAGDDPMSTVNKAHIPTTCGKCHKQILAQFEQSVHGKAVAAGLKDAPVCTNCHGEHNIKGRKEKLSSVYPTHVVATCSKCHENAKIQRQYGLPANRLSSYIESYHGIANKLGEITVANCATCHGAHLVLPSKDPRSMVNKSNLPHTCGKCHPGASSNFAAGTVHLMPTMKKDPLLYWVGLLYKLFVICLIGSFAGYIALDLFSRWRRAGGRKR
jgi:hypothetical protein